MNGTTVNIIARLQGLGIPIHETPLHRAAPLRAYRASSRPLDLPAPSQAPSLDLMPPMAFGALEHAR